VSYRDDEQALMARLHSLERRAARADELEQRVKDLELENQELREQLGRTGTQVSVTVPASGDAQVDAVYVDDKVRKYAETILNVTLAPAGVVPFNEHVSAGVTLVNLGPIINAARRVARDGGRNYVTPKDVQAAVRDLLPPLLILTEDAHASGVTASTLTEQILEFIDVP